MLELTVPRMTIDDEYIGEVPKLEVTMDNLNDNIDLQVQLLLLPE